jgi:hypothetical protein
LTLATSREFSIRCRFFVAGCDELIRVGFHSHDLVGLLLSPSGTTLRMCLTTRRKEFRIHSVGLYTTEERDMTTADDVRRVIRDYVADNYPGQDWYGGSVLLRIGNDILDRAYLPVPAPVTAPGPAAPDSPATPPAASGHPPIASGKS